MRVLGCALLAAQAGAAWADPESMTESVVTDALARPTPADEKGNWIAVPIPVANPTVGNGLQLAVLYLHPKSSQDVPGATSGIGAMATDQKTRLLGVFHDGSLADDRFRINAFAGVGDFNLKFYGVGDRTPFADHPLPYNVKGTLMQLRGEMRLPGTENWYAGATYQYLNSTLTVQTSQAVPGLSDLAGEFTSAGLGPHLSYDSRDSNYFPKSGQQFRLRWLNYGPQWGGDFRFDKLDVFYNHYLPLGTASVLALRVHLQGASEDTPFLFLPTLDMRGFSRDRYRDSRTVSMTAEWRHKFAPRWGIAAYAEAGRFASSIRGLADARTIATVGTGLRWQVTADRDMHLGLDFAISTDDRAVFLQIGERF